MTSHRLLADWSQWFWPVFANHLWQATLFAFVVWIAVKFFDRAPARFRYFLWMGALAKFLIPSAALVWLIGQAGVDLSRAFKTVQSVGSAAASGIATAYAEAQIIFYFAEPISPVEQAVMTNSATGVTTANHQAEFYSALTIVWLLGAMAFTFQWLIRRRRFARSTRGGRIITSGREFDALKRARSWLFVNRDVGLVVSSRVCEPGVWLVRRPVIVLPEGVAGRLSDEEVEAVMMHELVHVLHRDNLIGSFQMIVCSLLWFHPLAWLIDRRLLAEREMWCDETVIRLGGEPKLYATSLWKVVQFSLGWPVAGVSRAAGSNLTRRLERMLTSNNQFEMTSARRAAAYASFIALALLAVAIGLPGASANAQRNKIQSTDKTELSQGAPGGVPGGGPVGAPGGGPGGVVGGIDGAKTAQPLTQDNKGVGESQQSNKWEFIKQAPEFSVQMENQSDAPILITDAKVRVMADDWNQANKDLETASLIIAQFNITLVNQTDRRIKGVVLEYKNPGLAGGKFQIELLNYYIIEPHGSYVAGKNMLHHHTRATGGVPGGVPGGVHPGVNGASDFATRFTIRIAGVKFENEPHWGTFTELAGDFTVYKQNQSDRGEQDQPVTDPIQPMSRSMRPTILYREKAQYTQEARDNKVEGVVILRAVFGADAQIRDIEVERGLPHGLTENAIEATKKIRFEPALRDGQPVSVRGKLEYAFNLYNNNPIQQMDSSTRPTIAYREKAEYTQEARDNKVEGTVVLSVVFGVDGQISDVRVIRGLPYGLTQKAIEATRKIRFEPAMIDGQPVSVRGELEFQFKLY